MTVDEYHHTLPREEKASFGSTLFQPFSPSSERSFDTSVVRQSLELSRRLAPTKRVQRLAPEPPVQAPSNDDNTELLRRAEFHETLDGFLTGFTRRVLVNRRSEE